MYRKYLNDLVNWMNNPRRKPLIVWGARQVGKSYLIKNIFAETYYKNSYVYIDCRTDYRFVDYCMNHVNLQDVLQYISLDRGIVINKDTLLIFDEAQECLPIITLMKYFCQEHKEIPIIVTGSMVRMKIQRETRKRGTRNTPFLFPIGKINELTIYPMNFEEFLVNKNKVFYQYLCDSYQNKVPLSDEMHQKGMDLLYEYLLVGGMPEALDVYFETGSYLESRKVLKELYDNYLADMELYQASHESIIRSKKIFECIFRQLNKASKNFKSSLVEEKAKNRDLLNPITWLETAFLVEKSYLLKEQLSIPLIETNESIYRLYLSDIGMFSYQSGVTPTSFITNDGRNSLSGIFYENYIANELTNAGYKLFYWKGHNNFEFEFVVESDGNIIPIDVKKNKRKLNSLNSFMNHNKLYICIKISSNNFGYDKEKKILTVPLYEAFLLIKDLKEGKLYIDGDLK